MRAAGIRLGLFVVAALAVASPAFAGRVYRIATVPWVGWSPLDVAEDQGFWRELGVDVEIQRYPDGVSMHDAMRINKVDLGMDMLAHVMEVDRTTRPATILGETDWSDGGDKFIVQEGFDLKAHPGAPLGVYLEGPALAVFLAKYLASQGLHLSDYRLAPMPPDDLVQQFQADRIPAVVLFNPFALELENSTPCRVVATTADFPGCVPEGMYTFQTSFTPQEGKDLVAIMRGWIRGVRWIEDPANAVQYRRILRERTFAGRAGISDEDIDAMLDDARIHNPRVLRAINRPGGEASRFLAGFYRTIGAAADSISAADIDRVFQPTYLLDALAAEGVTESP